MTAATVRYSSNNSGGSWWLDDADWHALEAAGWDVDWYANSTDSMFRSKDGRWLGALAASATRTGLSMADAISEWENVTGENSADLGCSCCGTPHSFTATAEDGTTEYWTPDYPETGNSYGGDW